MKKYNKIAVISGTDKAGKYLVKQLLNQCSRIKVLLRNPDKLEIGSPLIEKIIGDTAINNQMEIS